MWYLGGRHCGVAMGSRWWPPKFGLEKEIMDDGGHWRIEMHLDAE